MDSNRPPMNLASGESIACAVCKNDYATGNIDEDDLEYRIEAIIGLHGPDVRRDALTTAEYAEITSFGDSAPLFLATRWSWPGGSPPRGGGGAAKIPRQAR